MKTTLEISDPLFRKMKATAALKGVSLKDFVTEAVKEKLARPGRDTRHGWKALFGDIPAKAAREIHAIVTGPDFRTIDPEDWK